MDADWMDLLDEKNNEIERLREDRERLREALQEVLAKEYVVDCKDVARAALKEGE